MLYQFNRYIETAGLLPHAARVLLAVSGGVDSMVMARLFISCKQYTLGIAHCNFSLRGEESDGDELLVRQLAQAHGIPFYTIRFDTTGYAQKNGISIQMAARDLRYKWFKQLSQEESYAYIAIAHNRDDDVETFLINLTRGTGIKGLSGMSQGVEGVIRPLLFASRRQIEQYASEHQVPYRNDSTNATDSYARNRIRHNVVPQLRIINPSFDAGMQANMKRIAQVQSLVQHTVEEFKNQSCSWLGDTFKIHIDSLLASSSSALLLFELLAPYNFSSTSIAGIEQALYGQPGKQFFSQTHYLLRDREYLLVQLVQEAQQCAELEIDDSTLYIAHPIQLQFEYFAISEEISFGRDASVAYLDADKLTYPLVLRKWKAGDSFIPFGMKGRKKLSDFLIDSKLSLNEKQEQYVLLSGNDIVWVAGLRSDERYRVASETKRVLRLSVKKHY